MVDTQRKSTYGNSRKSAGNCHMLPLWELVPSFSSRRIWCCVVTQLLLRRDVSDATSGRNFFRIDGEVMNKDWNPQALNRKNAFLLNTFCVFLKKTRWNLLNSLKWTNYESFTSIEIMIWQQSQFLQYAYVCCQTTLLSSKDTITTRNNNRYIGIIYIK